MRKAKWLLAVSLIITLLGVFIASGVQTVGGTVSIKNISIASEDGKTISALLFVPDTATNKTPAPAVLAVHGYVNVKEHMTEYAIELARRGYVVLAPDLSGHGYSERSSVDGALMSPGASGGVNDDFNALYNMPFVDKKNISLIGHSMGAFNCHVAETMNPDKVKALGLMGYCPVFPVAGKCNVAVLMSKYDESGHFFLGTKTIPEGKDSPAMKAAFNTKEPVEAGKLYGSFSDGTARQWFMPENTHPGDLFRAQPIADIIGFLQNSSPAPNPIDPNNQIWKWHQFGTLIALLGFAFSIFATASLMLKTKYFGALVQTAPMSSGLKGIYQWIGAVAITAIPALTLFKFGTAAAAKKFKPSSLLPEEYANMTFTWAAGTAVIFLVLFAVWHFATAKSAGNNKAITRGLSTSVENSEFKWKYIGKALLLAIITLGIPYVLLCWVYSTFHLDYRFIVVMLHPMDMAHLKIFPVYLVPSLLFFFAASLVTNNWFKTKEFTGARAVVPYAVNALITVGGLIVLDLIQYIAMFQTGSVKWPGETGIELMLGIMLWQMVPLLAFASMITTYFYRKTANIYTGVFTGAALVAWYSVCINAINIPF